MAADDSDAFAQLKQLLLGETSSRLDAVSRQVENLDSRVGDDKKFSAAVGDVLVEAFQRAEMKQSREMSAAVAPLVVNAIRNEIKNSKDMMVEALYPITGRLVSAAVANAFKELVEELNARIDAMTSANGWRLRLRAMASGKSMAEVALAEAEASRLRRALLLERGSGRLLAIWPESAAETENADLTGGMIAAITEFASSVYADTGGELRMLDLGSSHVLLRASPRVIVAAEFGGRLPGQRTTRLDQAFLSIVERHDRDEAGCNAEAVGALLSEAVAEEPPKPRGKTPVVVFGLVVVALAVWAAWGPVTRAMRESRIEAAFARSMGEREHLAQFPLRLEIDHAGERVVLRGLAANEEEPRALAEAIAEPALPYRVERDVTVVALAAQADTLRAGEARAAATLQEAQQQIDGLRAELREARAALEAPRARLQRMADEFAVFFAEGERIIDMAQTEKRLDALAALVRETGFGLRVVGHADDVGSPTMNRAVSRKRAESVAQLLVARGVARDRLSIIARSTYNPIADTSQENTRSRRVTFELPYSGEFDIR